jgi:YidC/Oxa1 family membrane protein insertase
MRNFSPRTILWLVFVFSIFMLWNSWQMQHIPAVSAPVTQQVVSKDPANTAANAAAPLTADQNVAPKGSSVVLENDVLRLKINTEGGVIEYAELLKHKDAKDKSKNEVLFNTQDGKVYVSRSGLTPETLGLNHKTAFTPSGSDAVMQDGQNDVNLTLSAQSNGVTFKKTYSLKRGSYLVDVNHEVDNTGSAAIEPKLYLDLTRDGTQTDKSFFYSTFTGAVVYNDDKKFKKISFDDIAKGKAGELFTKDADNGWVGMLQHYFVSAWVLPNNEKRPREFKTAFNEGTPNTYSVREIIPMGSVAPATKTQLNTQLYVGPQDQQTLGTIATGLDLSVDYGWATIIAKPIHWLMSLINSVIPNWGWTIVALTILIKLAVYPLTAASFKSMAKMKVLAPRLKNLQEQYGDDKMKLNQAMMALYKEEKVNPAGGCLPMLIQMPVFLALFYVLQAAVEVRGAPWMGWIHDLSLPDPFYILPVAMMVTMFIQTKLNPKPADPMQAKMMLWMPLIFGVTFFWFPAGLVLYWVVSNIFSIVQQRIMNNKFGIKESLISLKDE